MGEVLLRNHGGHGGRGYCIGGTDVLMPDIGTDVAVGIGHHHYALHAVAQTGHGIVDHQLDGLSSSQRYGADVVVGIYSRDERIALGGVLGDDLHVFAEVVVDHLSEHVVGENLGIVLLQVSADDVAHHFGTDDGGLVLVDVFVDGFRDDRVVDE